MFKKIKNLFKRSEEQQEVVGKQETYTPKKGEFTLDDFAKQLSMMSKIGSMQKMLKYVPGMKGQISPEMLRKGQEEMKLFKAILAVMTTEERINPHYLSVPRKRKIAEESGTSMHTIDQLLEKFEQSKQFAKMLK